MIKKEILTETNKIEVPILKKCDKCGRECTKDASTGNIMEWQEFYHIRFTGGYGSVFGDGDSVECDLCQYCLKVLIGDICRIIEG